MNKEQTERVAGDGAFGPYEAPFGHVGRARVVLLTVIDEEFEAVRKVLGLKKNVRHTPYFVSDSDTNDWDVVLHQSADRTNVPVNEEVSRILGDLRPQLVILVGVAGGLCDEEGRGREGIDMGDVLIADYVSYVEFLKLDGKSMRSRAYVIDHPSLPLRRNISQPLSKDFSIRENISIAAPRKKAPLRIHIGSIVSGEKIYGDVNSEIQKQLLEPFDKALAVDMESIGVARAICDGRSSFWYHPRYAIIRGISDLVDSPDNNKKRAQWKKFSANAAAVVAKRFIEMFLEVA
jgi:nucleoside phosphorylase